MTPARSVFGQQVKTESCCATNYQRSCFHKAAICCSYIPTILNKWNKVSLFTKNVLSVS